MEHLEDSVIDCTITSPPIYDDGLYVLQNGEPEFGWKNYGEYKEHLRQMMKIVYKKTKEGGSLIIDCTTGPREVKKQYQELFPIPADIIHLALQMGWTFRNEIIWVKREFLYYKQHQGKIPNPTVRHKHDQILVFQKGDDRSDFCGKVENLSSVWYFPDEQQEESIAGYNEVYTSFPEIVLEKLLTYWSCPGDLILDPYAGSGQLVRVSQKLERNAIGVEYDSKWEKYW